MASIVTVFAGFLICVLALSGLRDKFDWRLVAQAVVGFVWGIHGLRVYMKDASTASVVSVQAQAHYPNA